METLESSNQSAEGQKPEQHKLNFYKSILSREANSLLTQYLPETSPQEPTKVFFNVTPFYVGQFKSEHYIAAENPAVYDLAITTDSSFQKIKEVLKQSEKEAQERIELWRLFQNGEISYEKASRRDKSLTEISDQKKQEIREANPKTELKDWEDPERLLQGQDQYSPYTWRGIASLVHELIHQKQAELNPLAFPVLTSSELDGMDPNTDDRNKLYKLLIGAHEAYSRTHSENSLFFPAVEGIATLGTHYITGRLTDDLTKSGKKNAAGKIRQVRKDLIYTTVIVPRREIREERKSVGYSINYVEGIDIMRKLYKHFGLKDIPRILANVDLNACHQIIKGSPQYQKIIENPALLPGLQQTT